MVRKKTKKAVSRKPAKLTIKKKPVKRIIKKDVKAPKILLKSKISKGLENSKNFQSKEIKIDLSTLKFCPECASSNFFYSKMRDELICRDCGGIFSKLTPEQMIKYKDSLN